MQSSEMIEWIKQIESESPIAVDDIKLMDIHVWPIIRIRLFFKTLYLENGLRDGQARKSLASIFEDLKNYFHALVKDNNKNDSLRTKADIVFLSDGVSFFPTKQGYVDKYCDPIMDRCHQSGLKTCLLTPMHEYCVPRKSKSIFIQPYIDFAKLAKAIKLLTFRWKSKKNLTELNHFVNFLNKQKIFETPISLMDIVGDIFYVRSAANRYKKLLKKFEPTMAFSVCYYSLPGLGFNVACDELDIPSVDIQHGVQSDAHIAYGHWTKIPAEGYGALPNYFWCWSAEEAAVITAWNQKVTKYHQPIIGGNLWLRDWHHYQGSDEQSQELNSKLQTPAYKNKKHILVTLQPIYFSIKEFSALFECMKKSSPDWVWWIRLHPTMLNDKNKVRHMLQSEGVNDFELELASEVALYDLLPVMHVHVTHSSATVLEAYQFGICSILLSEVGRELFQNQVRAKKAIYAPNENEIAGAIELYINHKKANFNLETNNLAIEEHGFKELMDASKLMHKFKIPIDVGEKISDNSM
ncbi:hypothetical protein [Legionella sp. W05-934-2]|uniref:hypothetical protein n=1 Tax=Legionella sp. W05-934-2 TaxID=1198649 RepID=UPI003462F652